MNYRTLSKKKLTQTFAEASASDKKKMLVYFMSRHNVSAEEKSPFEMMGVDVQKMLMALWLEQAVDEPKGSISLELLKRAPDSKKRAQLNVDNTHRIDPYMATAKALLKEASQDDLLKIVGRRASGKRPVKSIEDADYTVIGE